MVQSKINKEIDYIETKGLDQTDKDFDASMYQTELFGIDLVISLGKPKYTYIDKQVIYMPVYLIYDSEVVMQMGVYEIASTELPNILDEDGDVDLDLLSPPLLYKSTTPTMIRKMLEEEISEKESKQAEADAAKAAADEDAAKAAADEDAAKAAADEHEDSDQDAEEKNDSDVEDEDVSENDENDENDEKTDSTPTDFQTIFRELFSPIVGNETEIAGEIEDLGLTVESAVSKAVAAETEKDSEEAKKMFHEKDTTTWIEKYMRNNNFAIKDNDGKGDCFFFVIRDAFTQLKMRTTVEKLRKALSEQITEDVFQGYRNLYKSFKQSVKADTAEMTAIAAQNDELREQLERTNQRDIQMAIVAQAKELAKRFNQLKKERQTSLELQQEHMYMKGVNTKERFIELVNTCKFWADTWAISTLERILNVKFILLSEESFQTGDYANVLQCGELNDTHLKREQIFNPKHYILAEYNGYHYKLITYKNKRILQFKEIPFDLKKLIVTKCLERQAGAYNLIPEFVEFRKQIMEAEQGRTDDLGDDAVGKDTGVEKGVDPLFDEVDVDTTSKEESDLYDSSTVFQFYSRSNGKAKPGKGAGEKIDPTRQKDFTNLAQIPDWRKRLSNFWMQQFKVDGKMWGSVEHYYQAAKFKKHNPDFYAMFSLDSGSELSRDPIMAKGAGGKTGKSRGKQIRKAGVVIDKDFFVTNRHEVEMKDAMRAKFSQNADLKQLLIETKDAKLLHYVRGAPPVVFNNLMQVRKRLISENSKRENLQLNR